MGNAIKGSARAGHVRDNWGFASLVVYTALSVFFFGRSAFGHFSDFYVGTGPDPPQAMWFLTWWSYALGHHLNPFFTRVIWAPSGVNLTLTAFIPLVGVLATPCTRALGPVATYNFLCLLAPALAAWAAFVLCRYITRSYWPSLLAGYVFGFSPYMLAHILGNLNLVLVFPVPLAVYLVLRRLASEIKTSTFVILLSSLLVAQFLFFVETFATMTMFAMMAVALALAFTDGDVRKVLYQLIPPILVSYGVALALLTPYLYYLFRFGFDPGAIWPPGAFCADLLNFLIPTKTVELGSIPLVESISRNFRAGVTESGAFLSEPLLVIAALYAQRHWREPIGKLLVDSLVVICALSLGERLQVEGVDKVNFLWAAALHVPLISKALAARFSLYAFLVLAIILALWLSTLEARPYIKFAIGAATMLFLLPNLSATYWTMRVDLPVFFSSGLYKRYLAPGENVLILPYGWQGDSMLWHAKTDMYFRMAGGYIGFAPRVPKEFERWPMARALFDTYDIPDTGEQFRAFLANHGVTAIIAAEEGEHFWKNLPGPDGAEAWKRRALNKQDKEIWQSWLLSLGIAPIEVGGVSFYRLPPNLADYQLTSPMQMDVLSTSVRFDVLVTAADRFLSVGNDPAELSLNAVQRLKLLPSGWVGQPNGRRTPETDVYMSGLLLQPLAGKRLAVGVLASYPALSPIIDKYRFATNKIYVSSLDSLYHGSFRRSRNKDATELLVMVFDRAGLAAAAARIRASKSDATRIGQPGTTSTRAVSPSSAHANCLPKS